jgi:hypothetical protein
MFDGYRRIFIGLRKVSLSEIGTQKRISYPSVNDLNFLLYSSYRQFEIGSGQGVAQVGLRNTCG